ncbi:protein FAR-RED IMPAIRED RESPONSE 1-like [Trifolium pratense]|uniref:protein FAR-RED IMPAIRED RESPONSE 1-like n=1 Tax=Trifolium pratense TaxID=57577 RepID=UPI001E690586|nr:protein FAR-RED IMPAIRED RESPONSE 1-like [Trifolium pratense]
MAKALAEVMPETRHGLCTWHLMQNGIKNLGPKLLKRGNHFMSSFAKCMYEYEQEVKFELAWSKLVADFDVFEENWVKTMYALKEKWAACYMKEVITLGMRSTQLSESLNSNFKAYMKPNINIIQFFNHFESVVEEKRYNELVSEYESRHKLPKLRYNYSSILMQLAQIYTPTVFEVFHEEFSLFFATCIRERNVSQFPFEYVITSINDEGEWRVLFDPIQISISCNCRKFETFGILCCHALKVFEANDVKFVSEKYILKRWTKDARSGIIHDIHANEVVENPKLSIAQRYRQLCSIMIKFVADVSSSESLSQLAKEGLQDLYKKVMDARLKENSTCNDQGDVPIPTTVYVTEASGFKQRPGLKRQKRLKSCLELSRQKKRQKPTIKPSSTQQSNGIKSLSQVECTSTTASLAHPTYSYSQTTRHLPTQQFVDIESPSQMECATSSLEHPAYVLSQTTENQFSFTELLMESHVDK